MSDPGGKGQHNTGRSVASLRRAWRSGSLALGLGLGAWLTSCQCAQLPQALFACEPDGTCAQGGYVCDHDLVCRRHDGGVDAGVDAGGPADAGRDAGHDAGTDAGFDAGGLADAGVDAGHDADTDAGFDAGDPADAGVDAGHDAGTDSGFDAGCLPYDVPDDRFEDSNCDGIDGEEANAAFVSSSGSDAGDGSRANPFKTIAQALESGKPQILLANGSYVENLAFGSARLWGGYDSAAGWSRSSTQARISGSMVVDGDGGFVTLDSLDLEAPSATSPGGSSIALTIRHVDQSAVLNRLRLAANQGANGVNGTSGASGTGGVGGAVGVSGPDGGLGGSGAGVQICPDGPTEAGWPGGDGARAVPGDGADGGGGLLGGEGGHAVLCPGAPCGGADGGDGLPATDSIAGSVGDAGSAEGQIIALSWIPATGGTGATGSRGRGGGGGGGGGGFLDQLLGFFFGIGGGGGGGGSGGCGGLGGSGGEGGGGSIALVLIDASPSLSNVTLIAAQGGKGGDGALGGAGGPGGAGGLGGEGELVDDAGISGGGGRGAAGRAGGTGGQGGAGAGGPSVGLWCAGTSNPQRTGISVTTGGGGSGGQPNGITGLTQTIFGCP